MKKILNGLFLSFQSLTFPQRKQQALTHQFHSHGYGNEKERCGIYLFICPPHHLISQNF